MPTSEPARVRLFVYGTLRSGGAAAGLMSGCRLIGPARVRGTLYDVDGRYPALVLDGGGEVHGELWECDAERLRELDAYEGTAEGLFERARAEAGGEGSWVYVAGPRLAPALRPEQRVPNGRWPVAR